MLQSLPAVVRSAYHVETMMHFEDLVRWRLGFNLTYFASNHLSITRC